MPMSQIQSTRVWEVENVSVQVSVWEDAEGPICKSSASRVNLRRHARPGRQPRRNSKGYLTCQLMARGR
jgi:hypothetical protein